MMAQAAMAGAMMLLAGACSTAQAPPSQPPADPAPIQGTAPTHTCNPANIQQFLGRARSDSLEQAMLRVSGAATVRWAPFGTAVTMEYRSDRLTVFLDRNARIDRISCS